MGRLQSRAIGEVVAPVALLSGIALSPETTVRYGRHRRKTVISPWLPSLALLVIGSTPPSSSYRSHPMPQLLATFFYMASPATPSYGSLFPSDRLVSSAVVTYAVVGSGCRGFRPTTSTPHRGFIYTGLVPVDLWFFVSSCHTLR